MNVYSVKTVKSIPLGPTSLSVHFSDFILLLAQNEVDSEYLYLLLDHQIHITIIFSEHMSRNPSFRYISAVS